MLTAWHVFFLTHVIPSVGYGCTLIVNGHFYLFLLRQLLQVVPFCPPASAVSCLFGFAPLLPSPPPSTLFFFCFRWTNGHTSRPCVTVNLFNLKEEEEEEEERRTPYSAPFSRGTCSILHFLLSPLAAKHRNSPLRGIPLNPRPDVLNEEQTTKREVLSRPSSRLTAECLITKLAVHFFPIRGSVSQP
ncbi:hypothetical protein BGZ63DRAFT_31536 [Mariannaea sp. PMI_226]|nr:hypothetical protein BGZ63DRAFT_31536 [Mariannaea sp. PMI_226]